MRLMQWTWVLFFEVLRLLGGCDDVVTNSAVSGNLWRQDSAGGISFLLVFTLGKARVGKDFRVFFFFFSFRKNEFCWRWSGSLCFSLSWDFGRLPCLGGSPAERFRDWTARLSRPCREHFPGKLHSAAVSANFWRLICRGRISAQFFICKLWGNFVELDNWVRGVQALALGSFEGSDGGTISLPLRRENWPTCAFFS